MVSHLFIRVHCTIYPMLYIGICCECFASYLVHNTHNGSRLRMNLKIS